MSASRVRAALLSETGLTPFKNVLCSVIFMLGFGKLHKEIKLGDMNYLLTKKLYN